VGGIIVIALVGFALYFMANHKHHAPKPVVVAPVGSLTTNPTDDAALVWIPAGPFVMGSTDADGSALRDEKPAHTLDGYYIYKNDVTVAQYRAFCVATGRALPATSSFVAEDDQPVVDVSWDDAMAYASWANAGLPTEAQWEKAARGVNGIIYPWGNTWDPGKCVNAVGKDLTTKRSPEAIGSCPGGISPYGVYDMTGDVSQWCFDIYYSGYYDESPSVNPLGPQDGHERAVRGGAFDLPDIASFRVARRRHFAHTETADDLGFRCVYSPPHE
jgi:formylglycine-generating enzyme required for sulfatase activity